MSTVTRLICVLASHQGRERGIKAARLAMRLGVSERVLRKLVSQAREQGVPLCGKPESGYFIARTAEELNETCRFLENRAMHSLRALSRMRRVSLPELMGQLKLNQA